MSRRGIPASLERREFLVRVAAVGISLGLAAVIAIYLASRLGMDSKAAYTSEISIRTPGGLDPVAEERERASAYKEIRDYMDQRDWGSDIVGVYCRDSAHHISGGEFFFRGRVDLEQDSGELLPMDYRVTIAGNSVEGWEIRSVETEPVEGYSVDSPSEESEADSAADSDTPTAGPSARTPEALTP